MHLLLEDAHWNEHPQILAPSEKPACRCRCSHAQAPAMEAKPSASTTPAADKISLSLSFLCL